MCVFSRRVFGAVPYTLWGLYDYRIGLYSSRVVSKHETLRLLASRFVSIELEGRRIIIPSKL